MIDDSDGDFMLLASNGAGPWLGLIFIVTAIALYCIASSNEDACEKRRCAAGAVARLVDHECLCAAAPQ